MSLVQKFKAQVATQPDALCLIEGDHRYSFHDVQNAIDTVVALLQAKEFKAGDKLALMLYNQKEVLISLLAARILGVVVVPINIQMLPEDIAYVLQHAGAKAVIAHPDFIPKLEILGVNIISSDTLCECDSINADINHHDNPDELAFLVYTSGTTGKPKGVMLTENNLLSNTEGFLTRICFSTDDQLLQALPLFHSYGLIISLAALQMGASQVLIPKFQPASILQSLSKEKVTVLPMVPTFFNLLLESKKRHPDLQFPHLKMAVSGGASLPEVLLKQVESTFNITLIEGYGMTETSPVIAVNDPKTGSIVGSVGKPLENVTVMIADDEEILVKGPNVMQGYYLQPDETAETINSEGWLHTGDLGRFDEAGNLYITGRKKDLIIKAGENIAPRPIEEVILKCEGVKDCCVIGLPHTRYGEQIVACVIRDEDLSEEDLTVSDIIKFCRSNLANFNTPDNVVFLPEFPKNPTGKVVKRLLKENLTGLVPV